MWHVARELVSHSLRLSRINFAVPCQPASQPYITPSSDENQQQKDHILTG
jgi:hypothetical protein